MWSLIVSLYALGGAFGGTAGGPAAGALGYRKAMLVNNIFWIVAGLLQALAPPGSPAGPYLLIAGRLLCGEFGFARSCLSLESTMLWLFWHISFSLTLSLSLSLFS